MHVGEISFCDKTAFNIKSDETKKYILDRLECHYGIKIVQKHFDKYTPDSVKTLEKNPHLVCVRSNGNPYFLYLMRYNFVQYCIFIDKKVQHGYFLPRMIVSQVSFDDELFNDTLFEGEMTKCKDGKWYYITNDIIAWKGTHLKDINLPKRLNVLYSVLLSSYHWDKYDPFRICVKKYFRYEDVATIFENHVEQLPYTVRGLYFRPLFLRFRDILFNFDDSLIKKVERFKFKDMKAFISGENEIESHPVTKDEQITTASSNHDMSTEKKEWWIRKTSNPDSYDMFDDNNKHIGVVGVPTMKISKYLREVMKNKNLVDRVKLPFTFSEKFSKWVPCM